MQGRSSVQDMDRYALEFFRLISYFKHAKTYNIHTTVYHIIPVHTADAFAIDSTNFYLVTILLCYA